jgi:hypothetical protein
MDAIYATCVCHQEGYYRIFKGMETLRAIKTLAILYAKLPTVNQK